LVRHEHRAKGLHAAFAAAPIDVRNIRSELFTGKISAARTRNQV